MVFRFRMLSDENDRFVRDYEIMYDATLLDFHEFFTADNRWEKLREFTLMDMDDGSENSPLPMDQIKLGQIIHHLRDRLIYLFDMFGERAYYLELTGAYEAEEGATYPREIYAVADVPDQYDPTKTNADDDDGSIFDDVMSEFSDFEGDDSYDDEY